MSETRTRKYVLTDRLGTTAERNSLASVLKLLRWLKAKYPEYAPFKVRRVEVPNAR